MSGQLNATIGEASRMMAQKERSNRTELLPIYILVHIFKYDVRQGTIILNCRLRSILPVDFPRVPPPHRASDLSNESHFAHPYPATLTEARSDV